MNPDARAHIRGYYQRHATGYDRQVSSAERRFLGEHRAWAAGQVFGRVLEIGVGTGLKLPYYPAGTDLVGVDLSPSMVELARLQAAAAAGRLSVDLRVGDAEALDLPDESVDAVVGTYALCTFPDPLAALVEVRRVLKVGGRLVLVEHGPSSNLLVRAGQRLLDPLALRFQADHLLRDPVPYVVDAGLDIVFTERGGRVGLVYRVVATKKAT